MSSMSKRYPMLKDVLLVIFLYLVISSNDCSERG